MPSNDNASDRLPRLSLVLPYPGHIAEKLTDDPVIPFGYFKLYDNVVALGICGQNVDESPTHWKFEAIDPFILEKRKPGLYEMKIFCEVILQIFFVRKFWATLPCQLLNFFLYRLFNIIPRVNWRWIILGLVQTKMFWVDLKEQVILSRLGSIMNSAFRVN